MLKKKGKKQVKKAKSKSKVRVKKAKRKPKTKNKSKSKSASDLSFLKSSHKVGIKYIPLEGVDLEPVNREALIADFSEWQDKRIEATEKKTTHMKNIPQSEEHCQVKRAFKKKRQLDFIPEHCRYALGLGCIFFMGLIFLSILISGIMITRLFYGQTNEEVGSFEDAHNLSLLFEEAITTLEYTTTTVDSTTTTVNPKTTQAPTTTIFICNPPYIIVGSECCLDLDGNGICDSDEAETTKTTLGAFIRCRLDADCGPTRVEYDCQGNIAQRQTIINFCRMQGTLSSHCETKMETEDLDICSGTKICAITDAGAECKDRFVPSNFIMS
jgi:hypothetical protein